jgi:DNA helicase HerA-like ATPase
MMVDATGGIFVGGGGPDQNMAQTLLFNRANRHGLVAGATGTGKTVTLQILAEGFAMAGVPVFCADVKGDLSGLCQSGSESHKLHDKLRARSEKIGLGDYPYSAMPVTFWDLFGENGHPVRATVSDMGPLMLARLMDLNPTQEGVLTIAFEYADDEGLLILDLKDLRSLLNHVSEIKDQLTAKYGNVSAASVGAIQRSLLVLEREGADLFFGETQLDIADLMRTGLDGRGMINILDATRLINSPRLYSTFLLWMLSELFETLPEVGDPDKPKLVFFFDEAHLLFDGAPKALLDKVEQVVKLIRSKGVGVYFVTQNPRDVPDSVLAQLGNRIQHALRAYTPSERKAIKAASDSFRPNPDFDTETVITELGVGEALVSLMDAKAAPTVVQRTLIRPPASRLGPATPEERQAVLKASSLAGRYDKTLDRESAYEILAAREKAAEKEAAEAAAQEEKAKAREAKEKAKQPSRARTSRRNSSLTNATNQVLRTAAREVTRQLLRGLLGGRSR